jgi:formylglycine-generating enzyme required for sulfatase activity/WD40 repeat protein
VAYVPSVTNDVFISYAHADNDAPFERERWVTRFVRDLERELKSRIPLASNEDLKIYFDEGSIRSNDNVVLSEKNARSSAIFVAIVSPSYFARVWPQAELAAFMSVSSSAERIFVIESLPPERSYPPALASLTYAKFWTQPEHSEAKQRLSPDEKQWNVKIHDVAEGIKKQLSKLHDAGSTPPVDRPAPSATDKGSAMGPLLEQRFTELFSTPTPGDIANGSYGSGFLLGNRLVLTARHVIVPAAWGGLPPELEITAHPMRMKDPHWIRATLVWPPSQAFTSDGPDVAVLRLDEEYPPDDDLEPLLGLEDDDDIGPEFVIKATAVGFPRFAVIRGAAGDKERRYMCQIGANVRPYSGLNSRTYELEQLVSREHEETPLDKTANWSGFSGAPLLAARRVIGVVILAPQKQETWFDFRAVRLGPLLEREDFRAVIAGAGTVSPGAQARQAMPNAFAGGKIEENSKAKVFICYSRKDIAFANQLMAALEARGIEPVIDRSDIHPLEDWWKRIEALIAAADTILVVLSPDAVASSSLLREVAVAASLNKRIAPIVYRPVEDGLIPEALAKLNFIFFDDAARFETSADQLAEALNTDISWIIQHTWFGEQARHWAQRNRPAGLLLRSPALEEAERWIASQPRGASAPTEEMREYISQSRQAATLAGRLRQRLQPFLTRMHRGTDAGQFLQQHWVVSLLARAREGPVGKIRAASTRLVARVAAAFIRRDGRNFTRFWTASANTAAITLMLAPLLAAWATASILTRGSRLLVDPSLGSPSYAHKMEPTAIVFSSGTQVATSSYDGTIKFWDLASGNSVRTVPVAAPPNTSSSVAPLAFTFDKIGRIVAITESGPAIEDQTGNLQIDPSAHDRSLATQSSSPSRIIVPFAPQVANAIGAPYATARNWYPKTGKGIPFVALAIPEMTNTYAVGAADGRVAIETTLPPSPQGGVTTGICVGANGNAVPCDNVTDQVLPPRNAPAHTGMVTALAASKNGNLASVADDGTVILWTLSNGRFASASMLSAVPEVGERSSRIPSSACPLCSTTAFSDDGTRLITAGWGGTAQVWDTQTEKLIQVIQQGAAINAARLSRNGATAITAGDDGAARVWDVKSGALLAVIRGHREAITRAELTPDGTALVTAARDGSVRVTSHAQAEWLSHVDLVPVYLWYVLPAVRSVSRLVTSLNDDVRWYFKTFPYTVHPLSPQAERALKPGDSFRECADKCPEMVVVPGGNFIMGSRADEGGPRSKPQHEVTIARQLAVSKFPVTFADWDACVSVGWCAQIGDSGYGRGQRPVINVNWNDAQQYVAWLSKMTGKPYRLLSEAEWEYAARAGTQTAYFWGDEIGYQNANCNGCGSQWDNRGTSPVGSFKPNAFGLYDMAGNVWQWVQDCYQNNYNEAPTDGSALSISDCSNRVVRGGSWLDLPEYLRSPLRLSYSIHFSNPNIGFRLARTLAIE